MEKEERRAVQYWLMKCEPGVYSIADLKRDIKTLWEGVRNYQARNFIREMRKGDKALFYHSNASPSGVAGIMTICSDPYPDPTQFQKRSAYYDEKATEESPRWFVVDVCFERKFEEIVPLSEIKTDKRFRDMLVTRKGDRLSIQPVEKRHFELLQAPDSGH